MSREGGKIRTTAKRQPTKKPGRRQLEIEQETIDLDHKAEDMLMSMTLESQTHRDLEAQHQQGKSKTRSRQSPLHPINEDETPNNISSSDHDDTFETTSKVDSHDTRLYSEQSKSSPNTSFHFGMSPSLNTQVPPFQFNPQIVNNPPQASPSTSAPQLDHMAMMQAMFAQQAQTNRQQQEAMLAHQAQISKQQAEANQQLQLLLAKSLDRQLDQQDKQLQHQTNVVERQAVVDARVAIKPMKEGINIVQYFEHLESELEDAQIPLAKWKTILVAKLSTRAEKTCAHLIHNTEATYRDLKKHLLKHIGPSADELCNIVHGAAYSEFQDKKETQKLQHAKYIAERYFLGTEQENDKNIEHMAVRLYKFHCHKKFSHTIKLSKIQSLAELLEMTSSFDSQLDYEKSKADKHSNSYTHRQSHKRNIFCDYCRKPGHIEADCFKKQNVSRQEPPRQYKPKYTNKDSSQNSYSKNNSQSKETGIKTRPATVNWSQTNDSIDSFKGLVNGHEAEIILDTGAQVTVVPGKFIYTDNLTGNNISILGVNGSPRPYQTATIPITINNVTVEETVAVASEDQLNSRVLLATPIGKIAAKHLLKSYLNKHDKPKRVQTVTRSLTSIKAPAKYSDQLTTSYNEDERASDLSYQPTSDSDLSDREDSETEISSDEELSNKPYAPVVKCPNSPTLPSSPHQPTNQTLTPLLEPYSSKPTTEPTSSNPPTIEPYSSNPIITFKPLTELDSSTTPTEQNSSPSYTEPYSSPLTEQNSSPSYIEPYSSHPKPLNNLTEPYSSDSDSNIKLTEPYSPDIPDLPILLKGNNIETLKNHTKTDPTLRIIRGLAHHHKNGYVWDNGLIFHMTLDPTVGERKRLVIPKSQRQPLMEMAHDRSGHFSVDKTRSILNNKFTWPGMGTDVRTYILACVRCKQYNKTAHKQAPLHNRPVITEPHDEVALDIVGPLPRSKQGYRFALTAICMASRWPEVYPLKDTGAENIVNGLVEFLARNGIPSKILTDQGSQFTSGVMAQTCQILGITHIKTVPYRPQGNGILERFHGTLKPLLAKAASSGIDWTQFLPLALSAIRAIPCRSTGFSPAELVFGRNNRSILDVVYEGWTNSSYSLVDVSAWAQQLNDKLEILRDAATLNNHQAREKQNSYKPNSKSIRVYKPGDLVFSRIPGCRANLQASWEGPFKITKSIPPLNYEVQDMDNTWSKITHINNLRSYKPLPTPKPLQVQAACLVAEETKELAHTLSKTPSLSGGPCIGYSQQELDKLLNTYDDVFSPTPGEAKVTPFQIKLQADATASSRPPYQVPIHLRGEVNKELDKLISNKIIEPSNAVEWCAPIVPVRKPDKSIRLCVDYREINKVTPLDRHVIPTLPQILDNIGHADVLSKIDLTSGFHQIQVDKPSRDLTTFLSPRGKYRFTRMPFGLKNAPSHFQRIMEKVLEPVVDCASVYIDDIVVFSKNWSDHMAHLSRVFECIRQAGMTAKTSKCSFGKTKIEYLGHTIGSGQLAVPEHRIASLATYKRPTTKKTLRSFLGCMSYYRRFIPKYSDMSAVLTPSTSVSAPRSVVWTPDMDRAFQKLKVSLCDHVSLIIPSISDSYSLHTDASGFGVGACLHVCRGGDEIPVAFFSRQLQGAEKNYSITELETLAIVSSLKHFEFYVYGTPLIIYTDHKACISLLTSTVLNNRLKRMTNYLQDKELNIVYRPGKDSGNADGLSRQFDDETTPPAKSSSSSNFSLPQLEAAGGCGSIGVPPHHSTYKQ